MSVVETEDSKVKFSGAGGSNSVEQNGDVKLSLDTTNSYTGYMEKEELMRYANDPFWVRLRWFIFILFWLLWLAMLAGAIAIVVITPKCPPPPERSWWQTSPGYQVYVKSFKDSNGDGFGDLKGIQEKLDYFETLNVETIVLSPIFKSSDGTDDEIEDFMAVSDVFGTTKDFKSLAKAAKEKGIRLVLDFIPNHTGKNHSWFEKSKQREKPYDDYYIWVDAKPGGSPNNWLSLSGESAWSWDKTRKQFYYHQYGENKPDLNLRNKDVVRELKKAMSYWLDMGVSGFTMNSVGRLFEDVKLRDEPKSSNPAAQGYDILDHIYTTNQPENLKLLKEMRGLLNRYNSSDDDEHERVMFTSSDSEEDIIEYYGKNESLSQLPFNFLLTQLDVDTADGVWMNSTINAWVTTLFKDNIGWPSWILGTSNFRRIRDRVGEELVDAMNMVSMLLPGTPVTYYGEEIGMANADFNSNSHDKNAERTPMQWDSTANAGFSSGTPWKQVNSDYETVNVKSEGKESMSHLDIYKDLVKLRKEQAFLFGETDFPVVTENLFAFTRTRKGTPAYCVVVNFGDNSTVVNLSKTKGIPEEMTLVLPEKQKHRSKLKSSEVVVKERSGLVLSYILTEE